MKTLKISDLKIGRWKKVGKSEKDLLFELYDNNTKLQLVKTSNAPTTPPIKQCLYKNLITNQYFEIDCEWDWLDNTANVRWWK